MVRIQGRLPKTKLAQPATQNETTDNYTGKKDHKT